MELHAQQSLVFRDGDKEWKSAMELYRGKNYGAARQAFSQIVRLESDKVTLRSTQAQYYSALCAIELFRPDAEKQMKAFVREHPESALLQDAYFQLGSLQYRNRKYRSALVWYSQVDEYKLKGVQLMEFKFKRGYCFFIAKDLKKAANSFFQIKDIEGRYKSSALYYYSHIAYVNKNYQVALNGFNVLSEDPAFSPVVPYYICQIYFLQGKYNKVVSYAPEYLEQASTQRIPEIARIIGQAYYSMHNYAKAIPYLEKFQKEGDTMERQDKFELGYCYYKLKKYDKAIGLLEEVGGDEDALLQTASYCLADCYLNKDFKQRAKTAFAATARMDFDAEMQQDALFNYAKMAYELSYSPFNETIKAFDKYLQKYPDSDRNDQAYDYLVKVYMTTRNYQDALESMDKIHRKTVSIEEAYQRVAYLRALELIKQLNYQEGNEYLDKSLKYRQYNSIVASSCLYWKGEVFFRMEKYLQSIKYYNDFLLTPGASQTNLYDRAHYNLGYACFKLKHYERASIWFRKFENRASAENSQMLSDARNRIGDYYFLNREYALAVKYYDRVISSGNWDADYSRFQKGFALGLLGRPGEKIEMLQDLIATAPESAYADDAFYEMGKAYVRAEQETKALKCYQSLVKQFPSSNYLSRTLLQVGLLHYNSKQLDLALLDYKKVVQQFPGTPEFRSAMIGIKNIYLDMNKVDDYFAFVKSLGHENQVDDSQRDSLTYLSAEKLYMSGNLIAASDAFQRYKTSFPQGGFLLNANFYKAQCDVEEGNKALALDGFEYVVEQPQNLFTEQALLAATAINYEMGNFQRAGVQYHILAQKAQSPSNVLVARIGEMRCAYALKQYQQVIETAESVLKSDKVNEEVTREANFDRAKSKMALGLKNQALSAFRVLATETQSLEGAEAKFQVAFLLFHLKRFDEADKEVNNFIEMNSPHHYWLAESFLLLSDVYLKKNDEFQARYTLQSIIDNYGISNDGIIQRAQEKLNDLLDSQKKKAVKKDHNGMKIHLTTEKSTGKSNFSQDKKAVKDTLGLDEAKMILEQMLKNEQDSVTRE